MRVRNERLQEIFVRQKILIELLNFGLKQQNGAYMCCQFYEHFFSSFCANFLLSKKSQSQTVSRKRLRKTLFVQKAVSKFLGAIETWYA